MSEPVSFTLPNGTRVYAELNGYAGGNDECDWSSIDICAEHPDKYVETLCCADFETKSENNPRDRLRVMAFAPDDEDPAYKREFPFWAYSIWLQHEEADDTYDVSVGTKTKTNGTSVWKPVGFRAFRRRKRKWKPSSRRILTSAGSAAT